MRQENEKLVQAADSSRLEAQDKASSATADMEAIRKDLQVQSKELAAAREAVKEGVESHAAEIQRLDAKLSQHRQVTFHSYISWIEQTEQVDRVRHRWAQFEKA